MLYEDELKNLSILILANKQDLPTAMSASEVVKELSLEALEGRKWRVQGACANTCEGVYDGLDWIITNSKIKRKGSKFLMFLLFLL